MSICCKTTKIGLAFAFRRSLLIDCMYLVHRAVSLNCAEHSINARVRLFLLMECKYRSIRLKKLWKDHFVKLLKRADISDKKLEISVIFYFFLLNNGSIIIISKITYDWNLLSKM